MISLPILLNSAVLAQAAADLPPITVGSVLAGLLVMAALVASVAMVVIWWSRFRDGQPVMPAATRSPMVVPLPLAIVGVVLTLMMAMSVLLNSDAPAPADAGDAEDIPVVATIVTGPGAHDAGAAAAEVADLDMAAATSGTDVVGQVEVAPQDPEQQIQKDAQFRAMMWQTLNINGVLFLGFGTVLWLAQQVHRQQQQLAASPPGEPDPDADNAVANPDADVLTAATSPVDVTNPYANTLPGDVDSIENERWQLFPELRLAAEAFLVAYLPTAALRILIVSLLPDAPSHPFLEMLTDGVDWNLMGLIALMAVVVAPLVEELLYRVTILGGLWQHGSLPLAMVVSSVLFAAAHGFPDSIALLPLAFTIAYVYVRRRSYRTVVLVHFLFNAFNMVIAGVSLL